MLFEVNLPSLSPTMEEGKIVKWVKKENDPILIQYRNKEGLLIVDHKLYYGDSLTLKKLQY